MKTLYLHIGLPKTGTSATQRFLVDNSKFLEKQGYLYRLMPWVYPTASHNRNGHFLISNVYREDGSRIEGEKDKRFEEGMGIVMEWFELVDNVILSEEGIWNGLQRHLKDLLPKLKAYGEEHGFVLKVVVYLRRQDEFLTSWWRQKLRVGVQMDDWNTFINHLPPTVATDYYSQVSFMAEQIGKENLIVRKYDRSCFKDGNLIVDFLDAIGAEYTEEMVERKETVNPSLTNNYADIKRVLNNLTDEPKGKKYAESNYFSKILLGLSTGERENYKCSMFSQDELQEFLGRYEESNNKVAKEFMNMDEPLFSSSVKDMPKWEPTNVYMHEDIVSFVGSALLLQQEENEKLRAEIQALREDVVTLRKNMGIRKQIIWTCRNIKRRLFGKK